MKIRLKLALRYSSITGILMLIFAVVIYLVSARDREKEFYADLRKEGISKANLYFEAKTTPEVMHSIYKNNIEYIDEVEVAIYDKDYNLLYHDAKDIDIIKETPELLGKVLKTKKELKYYEGKYQAILYLFSYKNTSYIITAAAYDGYGYSKQKSLAINLLILSIISILISFIIGYYLAKRALKPVAEISDQMKDITVNNLHLRLLKYNETDEFGELAASFNKALDIIEASYESQKMFVSNVSHELRTPLTTLMGEMDFALLKNRSSEEYKEAIISARQDAEHLLKFINGLLDLAKASYDENKIKKRNVRIDEILFDARESVIKAHPDYSIDLLFNSNAEDESEVTTQGNEYLLKLAFVNLMDNNCKFSDNKTSSVHISLFDNKIIIQFSDTGSGISKQEIGQIFTPFFRGENRKDIHGYGIGMALVQKVITLHKGNITVESVVGEGTCFMVTFYIQH